MEFTGERYVPSVDGQLKYEHLHRYALSLEFASGQTVLDLASGEGYGAAILASAAKFVMGMDADPLAVAHAASVYDRPNLSFIVGKCEAAPLADSSFDVITSFETIEHHDRHEEMLSEIKRLLKPGGVLVISSPNKRTYTDHSGYANPFHIKELYFEEFYSLLLRHFRNVRFYGQRMAYGSFVHPLAAASKSVWNAWSGDVDQLAPKVCALNAPVYFIAICSDSPEIESREISSVYLNRIDDLLAPQTLPLTTAALEQFDQNDSDNLAAALMRSRAREFRANLAAQANQAHVLRQRIGVVKARARYANLLRDQKDRVSRLSQLLEQETIRSEALEIALEKEQASLADARLQLTQQAAALTAIFKSRRWRLANTFAAIHGLPAALVRSFRKKVSKSNIDLPSAAASVAADNNFTQAEQELIAEVGAGNRNLRIFARSAAIIPEPANDIRGVLDFPKQGRIDTSVLEIFGWAYSLAGAIIEVEAWLDDLYLGNISYGTPRLDVVKMYPEAPIACGFKEQISLGLDLYGHRTLRIQAYDEHGAELTFTQSIFLASPIPSSLSAIRWMIR